MRSGSPAGRGTSTPPAPGRTRPAPRLPRAPGSGSRTAESGRRSSVPTRAGTGSRPAPLHLHHGPHLDEAVTLEDRAALGDLRRLGDVLRLDDGVAANQVLGLGERTVRHRLLLALDDLARGLERLAGVLDVTLPAQLLEPRHPLLHHLLGILRRLGPLGAPVKEQVLAHRILLLAMRGQGARILLKSRPARSAGSRIGRSRGPAP